MERVGGKDQSGVDPKGRGSGHLRSVGGHFLGGETLDASFTRSMKSYGVIEMAPSTRCGCQGRFVIRLTEMGRIMLIGRVFTDPHGERVKPPR